MYEPESGVFKGFSLLTGAFILAMSVMGFTVRILRVPDALDWFFIFYLLLLLVFPNSDSAFRMLVPLGFILLFYAAIGLRTVKKIPTIPLKTRATLAGLGMMLLFSPGIAKITETGNHRLNGPQQVTSEEAFDFIRKNINPQDVVVFVKPRALALYAGVKSMSDPFTADPTAIHKQLIEFNARYILVHKKLTKENTMRYVRMMKHRISKIWENDDFTLYRINLNHP
jgi:hypothetical protein